MKRDGQEIRCPGVAPNNQLHGVIRDFGDRRLLEIKCKDKLCGARNGAVVFHYWNVENGEFDHTVKYKNFKKASGQTSDESFDERLN